MVRAVDRAIDVLMILGRENRALGIGDLQSALKLSRPTLYRLLETLIERRLVRVEGDPQRYFLDVGVLRLADAWLAQTDVVRASEQILAELWNRTDETVALALPQAGDNWVLAREFRSRQPLAYGRGIGHTHPLMVGASGRVMLAFFEPRKSDAVLLLEPDGAKRENLRQELDQIRQDGFAFASNELIIGATAIAAPAFDHTGAAVASVCLYGPEIRLRDRARARYVPLVCDAARQLSRILGHADAQRADKARAS